MSVLLLKTKLAFSNFSFFPKYFLQTTEIVSSNMADWLQRITIFKCFYACKMSAYFFAKFPLKVLWVKSPAINWKKINTFLDFFFWFCITFHPHTPTSILILNNGERIQSKVNGPCI